MTTQTTSTPRSSSESCNTMEVVEKISRTTFAIEPFKPLGGSWEARNVIDLCGGRRFLVVETSKTSSGMETSYTVNTMRDGGVLTWNIFGDFNKSTEYKGVRCTEKTVLALHSQAMDILNLRGVLEAAIAFYEKDKAVAIA